MNDVQPSLKAVLKRLKLSGLIPVLPDRAAYASKAALSSLDFLELVLQDEIDRREQKNLDNRVDRAGFMEPHAFEDFDWEAPVTFDRDRVRDLFSLSFIERREDVLFLGPVGVGKTFLACALGHSACRAGHKVLFLRSDHLLRMIHQSRADNSTERVIRSLLAPDLCVFRPMWATDSEPSGPPVPTQVGH
jgi:DNA replication protein DnaC